MDEKLGLDAELAAKARQKRDLRGEAEAGAWLAKIVGHSVDGRELFNALKDGVVLCELANALQPRVIPKFSAQPRHYLEEKANIISFVSACRSIGVPESDLITPLDLSERQADMNQVMQTLYAIDRQAQAMRLDLPRLGVRYYSTVEDQERRAEKKRRERAEDATKFELRQKRLLARRQELEEQQSQRLNISSRRNKWKRSFRRIRRSQRGRSPHLKESRSSKNSDEEDDRSPSPVKYGIDADVQMKREESYDHELEDRILDWLEDVSGEQCDSLYLATKSGELLCRVVNILRPGTVSKIHKSGIPLLERENIARFIDGCASLGVPRQSLFAPSDLYDRKDLSAVLNTLSALARLNGSLGLHHKAFDLPPRGSTGFTLPSLRQFETENLPPLPDTAVSSTNGFSQLHRILLFVFACVLLLLGGWSFLSDTALRYSLALTSRAYMCPSNSTTVTECVVLGTVLFFISNSCALSSTTVKSVLVFGPLMTVASLALSFALLAIVGVRILAIASLVLKSVCYALFAFLPLSYAVAVSGHLVLTASSSALAVALLPIAGLFHRSRYVAILLMSCHAAGSLPAPFILLAGNVATHSYFLLGASAVFLVLSVPAFVFLPWKCFPLHPTGVGDYVPLINDVGSSPAPLRPRSFTVGETLRSLSFWICAMAFTLVTFSLLREFPMALDIIYRQGGSFSEQTKQIAFVFGPLTLSAVIMLHSLVALYFEHLPRLLLVFALLLAAAVCSILGCFDMLPLVIFRAAFLPLLFTTSTATIASVLAGKITWIRFGAFLAPFALLSAIILYSYPHLEDLAGLRSFTPIIVSVVLTLCALAAVGYFIHDRSTRGSRKIKV